MSSVISSVTDVPAATLTVHEKLRSVVGWVSIVARGLDLSETERELAPCASL